ncbi:MAG: PQQ-binding-like beta-propeller repeat protein [Planctomycetota bacterium]|nr:PQQ-binding-like beta-propeller repeat protein [Planctomycetota bacterium]
MKFPTINICLFLFFIVLPLQVDAEPWNRFRGENGGGIVEGVSFPVVFSVEQAAWQTKTPGTGNSSPVIGGGNLYLCAAEPEKGKRYLIALNATTGKLHWTREYPFATYKSHKRNGYASATPCLDDERVYVLWQSEAGSSVEAIKHDGTPAWSHSLGDFAAGPGSGTSPVVHGGTVFLTHDNEKHASYLLAINAKTGQVRWKTERKAQRTGFATPVVFQQTDGTTQIIFSHAYEGVVGVEMETGKVLWQNRVFGDHQQRAIGSPVVAKNHVIAASGFTSGMKTLVSLNPVSIDKSSEAAEVFRIVRNVPHVPTPLVIGDRLYLWTDKGILACVDLEDGRELWAHRIGGEFFASPICVGSVIYGVDRNGRVTAVSTKKEFSVLGKSELNLACTATPAYSNGMLYFRTHEGVIAFHSDLK